MDAGSCQVEETRVPREKHQPWMGDHYPVTCQWRESNLGYSCELSDISMRIQALKNDVWAAVWKKGAL